MITPAISVLSAVEGLDVVDTGAARLRRADHRWHPDRAVLFQKRGTARRGGGLRSRSRCSGSSPSPAPGLVASCSPACARGRLARCTPSPSSWRNRLARLPGARLGLPGGHRRRGPLRRHGALRPAAHPPRWFAVVLPRSLLNYFGQGALLLAHPEAADSPFYPLAPGLGALPADRPLDGGDHHRVPGPHLRHLLPDAASGAARATAPRMRIEPHLGAPRSARSTCPSSTGC